MEIIIPIVSGISIKIATDSTRGEGYPTSQLQRGLLLICDDQLLAEEGVGFGVPVLKRGIQTIFPGSVELTSLRSDSIQKVSAKFRMNMEERITRPGFDRMKCNLFYTAKNLLAALIRRIPQVRGLLTLVSNLLRWLFGWETIFEEAGFCTDMKMIFTIGSQSGMINIELDMTEMSRDGVTEVVVMNEQGANYFDLYRDARGTILREKEIGCWDEVTAEWGSFVSEIKGLAFTLSQLEGAKLFRGRELIGSRLAWSGFGYSLPPTIERINYDVKIERL